VNKTQKSFSKGKNDKLDKLIRALNKNKAQKIKTE
jgi:hypothetical protein